MICKRRILLIVLVLILTGSIIGCSGDNGEESTEVTSSEEQVEETVNYKMSIEYIGEEGIIELNPNKDEYSEGDVVEVRASSEEGWEFKEWSNGLRGEENPKNVVVTNNLTVGAQFNQVEEESTYRIEREGSRQGRIELNPNKDEYSEGDVVEVRASSEEGWEFKEWSNGLRGNQNPKEVVVTDDLTVEAKFDPIEEEVYKIEIDSSSQGRIELTPDKSEYSKGDKVNIRVAVQRGWEFKEWTNGLRGNQNPKDIVVNGNLRVGAKLSRVEEERSYRIEAKSSRHGRVELAPNKSEYAKGDKLRVRALAEEGWKFKEWSNGLLGDENPKEIVADRDLSIGAKFVQVEEVYRIDIESSSQGRIELTPDKDEYSRGDKVNIRAVGREGWGFEGWTNSLSGDQNPKDIVVDEDLNIGMQFIEKDRVVLVRAGTTSQENGDLTLGYDIYMGRYPVTFEEYIEYSNETGERVPSDERWGQGRRPVINISWHDALKYLNWLSQKEGLEPAYDLNRGELKDSPEDLEGYRLPTSDEWEYAARGGAIGEGTSYAGSNNPSEVAWYDSNSGGRTSPVGEKRANELGLYDMSGNVWEWTNNGWGFSSNRFIRGGSWGQHYSDSNINRTEDYNPYYGRNTIGFRFTRTRN